MHELCFRDSFGLGSPDICQTVDKGAKGSQFLAEARHGESCSAFVKVISIQAQSQKPKQSVEQPVDSDGNSVSSAANPNTFYQKAAGVDLQLGSLPAWVPQECEHSD